MRSASSMGSAMRQTIVQTYLVRNLSDWNEARKMLELQLTHHIHCVCTGKETSEHRDGNK